jgi:hypothetical protein
MWPISSCKKIKKCCNPHVYWWNRIGFKQSHFVEDLVATPRCMFLVSLFWRWDVQTLEYMYISKLPMKKERIWSTVKETTSHLQNKLTKNIHLGVATRSSTKWDCLKPIRFHQYTWGLYVLYGEMGLYAQLFLNGSLDLNETFPQVVIHCPKLCMKEYGSCQKFGRWCKRNYSWMKYDFNWPFHIWIFAI